MHITVFSADDGPFLARHGTPMVKRPNPVFMYPMSHSFVVQTNEGPLQGEAGGFVAHDPISGHVWPVSASYVEQHYDKQEVEG